MRLKQIEVGLKVPSRQLSTKKRETDWETIPRSQNRENLKKKTVLRTFTGRRSSGNGGGGGRITRSDWVLRGTSRKRGEEKNKKGQCVNGEDPASATSQTKMPKLGRKEKFYTWGRRCHSYVKGKTFYCQEKGEVGQEKGVQVRQNNYAPRVSQGPKFKHGERSEDQRAGEQEQEPQGSTNHESCPDHVQILARSTIVAIDARWMSWPSKGEKREKG